MRAMKLYLLLMGVMVVVAERADISTSTPQGSSCGLHCQSTAAVSSLLQAAGYSPTCIASCLTLCNQLHDEEQFVSHVEEMRTIINDLRPSITSCNESVNKEGQIWGPRNCKDLLVAGDSGRGVRQVHPYPERPQVTVDVYCDHTIDGGGWTVFQHRTNATTTREDFQRTWAEYQQGFGNLEGEFWLGLDVLHTLTLSPQELRVDLADYEGGKRWAKYNVFKVGRTQDNYPLTISGYTGDAGDSLMYHNNMQFSTPDADHDENSSIHCALTRKGGWWYKSCLYSNPNGYQYEGSFSSDKSEGISWYHWKGHYYSLMNTTLMVRPTY